MRTKKIVSVTLTVLLFCSFLLALCACTTHISEEGLDQYDKATSSLGLTRFLFPSPKGEPAFFEQYPYADGGYHYDDTEEGLGSNLLERAFAWLCYDDPTVYEQAKLTCMEERSTENAALDGKEAFGFTFYVNEEWDYIREQQRFPYRFTAFGYNDATSTLVFIGFCCGREDEKEQLQTAETDLAGFIQTYFGEWYAWQA